MAGRMSSEDLQRTLKTQTVGAGLLDLLLGSLQSVVCLLTPDGTCLFVSPFIERLTGHAPSVFLEMTIMSTVHPDDRDRFGHCLSDVLSGSESVVFEYRQQRRGGQYVWCEARFTPAQNDLGSTPMVLAIIHDVSARRLGQQQLHGSEARKTAMLDASLDAVIGTDSHGRVVEWNAAATKIFGYPRAEVLGRGIDGLIVPHELRARHLTALALHRRTGVGHIIGRRIEITGMRQNGQRFPCELTVMPVEAGNESQYIAYIRDLTEQHDASRRLHERDLQLRLIASQLPSVLWTTNPELKITAAIGAGLNSIGVDPAAFIGVSIDRTVRGTPAADVAVSVHQAAVGGISGFYPQRIQNREFDVHVEPLRDEHEQIIGALSLAVDVTERHRTQRHEADKASVLETIALGKPLHTTLRLIAELLERQRPGSIAQILHRDGRRLMLASGPRLPAEVAALLEVGIEIGALNGSCGAAAASGTDHFTTDIESDPVWQTFRDLAHRNGLRACWTVPVLASDHTVLGTLALYFGSPRAPGSDDLELLSSSARLAGIAMERTRDLEQVISTREETLRVLGLALEYRDYETKGHTDRVVSLSLQLADALGVQESEKKALRWGAYLHDVGKIVVPDQVLLKPGKPTPEEWLLIQRHPEVGYSMLRDIPTLPLTTLAIVRHHHERWDGSGYPARLSGEAIPWTARLFAVIDVYDALTNVRPYKRAWTHQEAMEELQRMSGETLDPALVEAFTAMMSAAGH